MRGLLKYAFVLALGLAIGVYVLGPPNLEDRVPDNSAENAATAQFETSPPVTPPSVDEELDYNVARQFASLAGWRAFLAAHPNGAYARSARAEVARQLGAEGASAGGPAAAAAASPVDSDQGYGLSRRIGSLASNAQSARARVERLLLGETAPASGDLEDSARQSLERKAGSESAPSVASPLSDVVPATDGAPSHEASRDAGPAEDAARHSPPAGADGASGAQLAALAPDEICRRDEDRLAQLRMNPSRGEVARFANELGCKKLRSQVLDLFESLTPPPAAANISGVASPGAPAESETAHLASPLAGADVASPLAAAICRRDEERLVRLRSSPSLDEATRFENELGCEQLRPQLQRLMESLDLGATPPPPPADPPHANPLLGQACAGERSALDRLREEPSAETAELFWREMKCEGLRPQVRLLLESLNVAADAVGSTVAPSEPKARDAASDAPAAVGADPAECRRETAELNRVRATPDLGDAKRFASTVTCGALRPQVARLLESFGD